VLIVTDFSAVATQPICGYVGPCRLHVTGTAIIVHRAQGEELATWLYNTIRQFNAVDDVFSFTSGRRGPFGVGDYSFELPQKKVAEIQSKISGYTGAVFAHNHANNNSSLISSMSAGRTLKKSSDSPRSRSESETVPSPAVSSNLYPQVNPPKGETYQNTGIGRSAAPPLPSKESANTISPQNNASLLSTSPAAKMEAYYVNAIRGSPRPLPRKTKPFSNNTLTNDGAPQVASNSVDANDVHHSPTLPPKYAVVKKKSPARSNHGLSINPVGAQSDLDKSPLEYGKMMYSPDVPKLFSPPVGNSGYSDVDYDEIRRNREMGKFSDPGGIYSDVKTKPLDTYDVPSSLVAKGDMCTYDIPRSNEKKFEDVPGVYIDQEKMSPSSDLYNVPRSSKSVSPDLYDVPSSIKVNVQHAHHHTPAPLDLTYDIPSKHTQVIPVRQLSHSPGTSPGPSDLYDVPRSNQPAGEHEMYDVVPRRSSSISPQPPMLTIPLAGTKLGYENIGPNGEILGEVVAQKLRQDLMESLGKQPANLRPLRDTKKWNLSRSCENLNDLGQEKKLRSQTYKVHPSYKGLVLPENNVCNGDTLPPSWRDHKIHRRLSGSLGDIPVIECDDNEAYVELKKVTAVENPPTVASKPPVVGPKPPIPAPNPKNSSEVVRPAEKDPVDDDDEQNDLYISMNRASSLFGSSAGEAAAMPLGHGKMDNAKGPVKKSTSSIDLGRSKESSPVVSEDRRNSDLIWPSNSQWSLPAREEPQRKTSNESDVSTSSTASDKTGPTMTDEHPIVVAKPPAKSKRSILLQSVGAQKPQEKRSGMYLL